jgi:hypothetical protein
MPAMTNYNANTIAYDRFLTKQLEQFGARTHGNTQRKEQRLFRFLEDERNKRVYLSHEYRNTQFIIRLN